MKSARTAAAKRESEENGNRRAVNMMKFKTIEKLEKPENDDDDPRKGDDDEEKELQELMEQAKTWSREPRKHKICVRGVVLQSRPDKQDDAVLSRQNGGNQ